MINCKQENMWVLLAQSGDKEAFNSLLKAIIIMGLFALGLIIFIIRNVSSFQDSKNLTDSILGVYAPSYRYFAPLGL